MLLGCCHCGETPSESTPPSQSLPPSTSQSLPPSDSASGPDYSVIGSSCISSFGCAAIPRRLTWNVAVSTGNWGSNPDCLCAAYDGSFTLKFCECVYVPFLGLYALHYATDNLGVWRGRAGFPDTDTSGCRTKATGNCSPNYTLSSSRLYYAVIYPNDMSVYSTHYKTREDVFPSTLTNLSQTWSRSGSSGCLSGSYTLTHVATAPHLDGCGWGDGTLSPG
jgi:hypothetical protein